MSCTKKKFNKIFYTNNQIVLIRQKESIKESKRIFYYQTISSTGEISSLKEFFSYNSLVNKLYKRLEDDWEFTQNQDRTKILINASNRENSKARYKTSFVLFDSQNMQQILSKDIDDRLFNISNDKHEYSWFDIDLKKNKYFKDLIGIYLNDNNDIYFCYSELVNDVLKNKIAIIHAKDLDVSEIDIPLEGSNIIRDVEFQKSIDNNIIIAGYTMVPFQNNDLYDQNLGIFNFSIDSQKSKIITFRSKIIENNIFKQSKIDPKKSNFYIKMDNILINKGFIYLIGEKYIQTPISGYTISYKYDYRDVLVSKLSTNGDFIWTKSIPINIEYNRILFSKVYNEYITYLIDNNIYILYNENNANSQLKSNISSEEFEPVKNLTQSSLNYATIDADGNIIRNTIFKNDEYIFSPLHDLHNEIFAQPSNCKNFIEDESKNMIIYVENKGNEKFIKYSFK